MTQPETIRVPSRIAALPVDPVKKIPVPWFVAWVDGKPEFRAMDHEKFVRAIKEKRCWICGEPGGVRMTFVVGPMCGVNRVSSEPPSHTECARYAAVACPFLSRPHMDRRTAGLEAMGAQPAAGFSIDRNPGVTLLWTTRDYHVFEDGRGGHLLRMGNPERLEWFCEGRPATHDEVAESVRTGLPILEELARQEPGATEQLRQLAADFKRLYPERVS